MAWEDRPYYRDAAPSPRNPLMWLLTGSVSLGNWFGIDVRLHASMILVTVLVLLFPGAMGDRSHALTFGVVLFGIVLLHEFGHCFASRMVGGAPTQIILTPLGGLAMVDAPRRPWATFVAVAGGPLVNVLICLVTGVALVLIGGFEVVPWNLFSIQLPYESGDVAYYLWFVYTVSYALLLFNLWPVFPLDGGQLLQSLLWAKFGYFRATLWATTIGIGGAIFMGMLGLVGKELLLIFIAISCLMTCIHLRRQIKAAGPWAFEEEEFAASAQWIPDKPIKNKPNKRAAQRAQKRAAQEAAEQQKIDAILAKVSAHGMHSLTWLERRTLHKATERQRQRDLESATTPRRRP